MVHLRKLRLTSTNMLVGADLSQSFPALIEKFFQLEEVALGNFQVGDQGVIADAVYNAANCRFLRVLGLSQGNLVDDDLNGIGALQNTLEELDLSSNDDLSNNALVSCSDLVNLKRLNLSDCLGLNDLSPLKDFCLNLEELNVRHFRNSALRDDSFKVFSETPNSFPNLRVFSFSRCRKLTEKVFEHLAKNNHLVNKLTELCVDGMGRILLSSSTARNNIGKLKGLQKLKRVGSELTVEERDELEGKLLQSSKSLVNVHCYA